MKKPGFINQQPRFGIPHKREEPRVKRSSLVTGTIRFEEKPGTVDPNSVPKVLTTYFEFVDGVEYYDTEDGSTYFEFE